MIIRLAPPLALLVALCAACSHSSPADACNDIVDALTDLAVRCGADRDEAKALVEESKGYSCSDIVALRDEKSFYDDCLPFFRSVTCKDFETADLPASCDGQLLTK